MALNIDWHAAGPTQIEAALCAQLEGIRLAQNLTQEQLATRAGVSLRTVGRLGRGEGTTLDSFIRVLMALDLHQNLDLLLPDPSVRPVERAQGHKSRQRARPAPEPLQIREGPTMWQWNPTVHPDD